MRTDGVSNAYRTRNVFGTSLPTAPVRVPRLQHARQRSGANRAAAELGIPWRPRLTQLWNADWQWNVVAPLVQTGEVSPWATLEPNYIAACWRSRTSSS